MPTSWLTAWRPTPPPPPRQTSRRTIATWIEPPLTLGDLTKCWAKTTRSPERREGSVLGKGDAVIVCCLGDRPTAEDAPRGASTCMCGVTDRYVAADGCY